MISIEFNESEVTGALDRLSGAMSDLSPVMKEIAEYLVVSTLERFPTGTAPDGTKWAAKSPATLAAYGGRKSNRIDVRPLFGPSGQLSSKIFPDHGPHFAEVGSNRIYAAVMQWGAAKGSFGSDGAARPIPWGAIPARPFLGLSAEDQVQIPAIIDEWLASIATP